MSRGWAAGTFRHMLVCVNRTKLRPPSRKGRLVERTALVEKLQARERPRLALIQAPAGFGKTSLLAQFFHATRAAGLPTAWLSLDGTDNDCTRFLQHLIAALEVPGVGSSVAFKEALGSGARLPPTIASDLLSNAVAELDRDVVVCVDDYHVLSDAAIEQLMASLMQSPNSRLSWVIATRVTPSGLPLSRLRLLGELLEIDARDLKFSPRESCQFFSAAAGVALAPALAELLNERAEGWVAGLQLASLTLAGSEDPAGIVRRFSGMNRNIAEFLHSEVLARLDDNTARFLLDTAILTRMNTELCNYVAERSDSRTRLDELEALNLFIFSLDDERVWYRYHQLFAGFLEQRLREFEPERARHLHERAAQWLEENGQGIDAIEHALKARAFGRAARLLDRLGLYEQGQIGLQETLAAQIPSEVLEQFPNLQLERNWGWQSDWDFAKCRQQLSRFKQLLREWRAGTRPVPAEVDLDYLAAKLAHRELMFCFVSDDMEATGRLSERWLAAGHPADSHMEVSARGALMAARREHYLCDDTELTAEALHESYQKACFSFGEIFQDCITGTTFFMQADAPRARQVYERALSGALALHGPLSPLASMPALLLAELHYEQGALHEAHRLVADYLGLAHGLGYVDKLIAGFITKSRLEFIEAQRECARRTLDDAEKSAQTNGFERLRAHVIAERLRQLALLGKPEEVLERAHRAGLTGSSLGYQPRGKATTRDEILAIAWSRAAAARGDLDAPIRLLKNWLDFTRERRCFRSCVRLSVELAKLLYTRNDLGAACYQLCEGVREARPSGFVQVFLDGGEQVREILRAAVAGAATLDEVDRDYAHEILASFGDAQHCWATRRGDEPPQPPTQTLDLNRRERDILELAAGDVPNREIARRLALSENTVKWYWKRIFAKLAVSRRLQAINTARAAGVIF